MGEVYSCGSGGVIAAGRNYLSPRTALIGDSLTEPTNYGLSSFYWLNGLNGGKLQAVANAGVSGNTVGNVLSRVDNAYGDGSSSTRGLAGIGSLGYIVVRIGTNDARASTSIASLAATYTSLLNKLATYAGRVIILAVPPLSNSGFNALAVQYNTWLAAFAVATPSKFTFVDDCSALRDGSNVQIASFFNADGIHFIGAGTMQAGITGAAAFGAVLGNYVPGLALAGDVYPAQPQWFVNPANAGTAGSASGGFSGTVATGLSISNYGSGISGTCSIVAADAGDANPTPWQRITPTATNYTGAGEAIRIASTLAGRAIGASDPSEFEHEIEIRLNALNCDKFLGLNSWVQGASGVMSASLPMLMGGGVQTRQAIARHKMARTSLVTHASAILYIDLKTAAIFSGAMGSIDFRNVTVRG